MSVSVLGAAIAIALVAHAMPPIPPCAGFTDVLQDDPACAAITWAKERDIIRGCAPDRYCGDQPVTRKQLAQILFRASKVPLEIKVTTEAARK